LCSSEGCGGEDDCEDDEEEEDFMEIMFENAISNMVGNFKFQKFETDF